MNAQDAKLSREQRRRLQRLTDRIDRKVLPADRRFFERFPHRAHRIGVASKLEIEANQFLGPSWPNIPDGRCAYVAVKQIARGIRTRAFFIAPAGDDTDLSEESAREIYDEITRRRAQIHEIEQGLKSLTKEVGPK